MAARELTDAEVFGGKELSDADVFGTPAKPVRNFALPRPIDPLGLNAGARVVRTGSVLDGVTMVDPQANAAALANAVKTNPALVNSPMYRAGVNVLFPQGENAVQSAMRRNAQDQAGQRRKQNTITAAREQTDAAFGDSPIAHAAIAPFRRMASGVASTIGALAGVPQLLGSDLGRETSEAMNLMAAANMPAEPGISDEIAAGIGQVAPMAAGGQILRAGLARLLGEKAALSAAGTAMGAAGGALSGNQVLNDLEFRSDLTEQEKQARAQGASILSATLGRYSDRFLLPGMKGGTGGVVRPIAGAFATQGGEEIADTMAQNFLTDRDVTEGALRAGLVGGATGATVRGVGVMAERQSPEALIAQIIEQAASQTEPAYRVAQGMTDAANTAQGGAIASRNPLRAPLRGEETTNFPALPYDPNVQNVQTLIADAQGNVRPEDSAEAFYRGQKELSDAEIGLTPDVRKAQEARANSEPMPAPQAEPELLQMLRRAGWQPQQEVFNQKPDLAPEQSQQLEAGLFDDIEDQYQADVKDGIRERLGMNRKEDAAPESYAQNPLLRLIASEGGINLDERSDFDIDPKRQTKGGRTMPAPYNINGKPLFRKGGLQGDMLVEKLQQAGYLTQGQIDEADANKAGGSYQLAYDMVSRAIQDPQSIGLDAQDAPTRRAQTEQAKRLQSDASQYGIDTRGMDERQIANAINRVQRRAEQPATPDFQSRKLSRVEQAETARGRAMERKLARYDRFQEIRDLDEMERSALAEVYFDDNGDPVVTTRTELENEYAYAEYQASRRAEYAPAQQDQTPTPREPASRAGSSPQDIARPQPGSDGARARESQDSDETLTSYTEEEVRQREQRAADEARKQERERIEQERKAEADSKRDDFTLSGSNRPADMAAARGQNALFTIDTDSIEVDGKQRPRLNSDGKPIAATDEATRNFWRWFGDSKVVDEQGRPRVVYHGTTSDFDAFAENPRGVLFTSPSPAWVSKFTQTSEGQTAEGGNILPVFVRSENPFNYENKKHVNALATSASLGKAATDQIKAGKWSRIEDRSTLAAIKSLGFDGVYVNEDGIKNLAVFSPSQIKSATGNRGTFDGGKKSILQTVAQDGQAESAAVRAATDKFHETERADRIRQEYQEEYDNQNTVDGDEVDFTGVERDEDGDLTDAGIRQVEQRAQDAIDKAVARDLKPINSLYDIDRYAGHRAARDAAKAYLDAMGVPYQEPRSAGSRYLEISSKDEDDNETLKLRFSTHETQSRQHTPTEHNWVTGNSGNDISNMLQSAVDFYNGATGVGENINFTQSQPSRPLAAFRKLAGDYSASTAKADAEQILGIDSPVPVLTKFDKPLAEKGVPMWYDLDNKNIYYNTAFKNRDRARDAQWMTEEILHAIDHTGGSSTMSLSSGRFNEGGDLRAEIEEAHRKSKVLQSQLDYPLIFTDFTDDRKAVELFARVGVLFKGFPEALQVTAPKTYEVYRDIFSKLQSLSGEVRQPSSRDSRKESGGLGADGDGRASAGQGSAGESADSKLERFRDAIVGAIQGERGGRSGNFGDSKLKARAPWHVPDPTRLDEFRRNWQDNKIDIRKTVEAIKNYGATIGDDANPYLRDELYIGRVRDQLDKLADNSVLPLLRAIANSGIKPDTVNRYLWARHAKERNQQMAKVNGDTFTDDLNYAGMSTKEARAELAKLASTPDYAKLQKIAAMVDDISRDTRTKIVTDGLEDAATIKAWEGAYKFYVPLQRDVEESGKRGQGYNVKGSEARRAVGSEKEATNILANVIAQAESAIIRSEKAEVGRSVLELAKQNPNPDFWTVDTPPTERVIDPRTGMVTTKVIPNYKNMDNVFVVKEAGMERFVVFNERNARAMEFSRNLKNLDAAEIGSLTNLVGKGTKYLSQWVTARNPLFWMTNFVRDVQGVAFNLQSTPLKGKAPQVMAKIPLALAGVTQAKLGKGGKYAQYANEFKAAGGQTGFMQSYENSIERMGEITKEIERLGQKAYDPRKLGRGLLDVIDGANDVIENGVRLAVFVQAREQGISADQAASIAKNISVNFNRKGNKTATLNSWYIFANANIQGNARLIEGIATSKRSQVAAGLLTAAGAAMAALNWWLGGDDEESRRRRYELVPAFERERNWIVFYPNSEKYLKIPLPLGPHLLFNAGRVLSEIGLEDNPSVIEKSASFASSVLGAFNPIGGGLPSADAKGVAQAATPSILRPVVDTVVNQNFAGTPIAKQDFPGSRSKPGYTQAKDSTASYWTGASKALNDISGGDNIKPGSINIKPETLAYLLKGYITPGIAQTVDKVASQAASSKPVDWVDRPGVSKFVGRIDEGNRNRAAYETREADKDRAAQYEAYLKAGDRAKAVALMKEWGGGDVAKGRKLYAQTEQMTQQEAQIARARREARKLPEDKRDAAMQSLDERRNRINAVYLRNRANITGEEE